jgi:hypothetical protein
MSRIAVMQPYLYPYPGYFRLMAAADCFVMLDCVQFNRRGRVHRVELPDAAGAPAWLTLPLRRQPRDVRIHDLVFADDARLLLDARMRRFPWLAAGRSDAADAIRAHLGGALAGVVEFLEQGLRLVAGLLGFDLPILRSSQLQIPAGVRGQDRILSVVRALGGTRYVNPPGGRHLYDAEHFAKSGVALSFLTPYQGEHPFLLPALLQSGPAAVRADVLRTTGVSPP